MYLRLQPGLLKEFRPGPDQRPKPKPKLRPRQRPVSKLEPGLLAAITKRQNERWRPVLDEYRKTT